MTTRMKGNKNTKSADNDVMQLLPQHDQEINHQNEDEEWSSQEELDNPPVKKRKKRNARPIIVQTTSDVYFQYQNMPAKSSNAEFPYAPLTAKETRETLDRAPKKRYVPREAHRRRYLQWKAELFLLDRSLMFTGAGSKLAAINDFATELSEECTTMTIDAFNPSITLREILTEIQKLDDKFDNSDSLEDMTKSVIDRYNNDKTERLVIVIHNIDSITLRAKKTLDSLKHVLGSSKISVIASIDHLTAPILFPAQDSAVGLNWVWHDLTTLEPYYVEMSHKATSVLQGAVNTTNGIVPTVSGAKHVLASVPDRARRLFIAIAKQQIEAQTNTQQSDGTPQYASPRHVLVQMAKQDFIATSEDAFDAGLAEFRDHGLLSSSSIAPKGTEGSGPEQYIWIPLDLRSLRKTVEGT
ncbi:origin recognition complex subunit 2 [Wallemia mellicola]|uniref:Origin recognition complex subunit 2 n=1 Tax=Wallemia mellicola TaxID=1708541 RepID=A0AB38MQU3_9BASI|nr:origin recognition complex subunit 2 [Wallemia mellicola]TIB83748.1 origin recognition complex subunit 2 [Wallemia mellicola]TIC05582.1 origin recognition complex subunit 2 [Wallemia mellicola]TIC23776.1 origin recognition complex subunit 2 [Wallemia mellicola]TIC35720.1 origin recognition complex subunit 2 [Wallemia mellicola]